MTAAPRAMKIPRMTRASTIPHSSTVCWYSRGTANLDMMITKTNRLSIDSEYSVIHPAKNSAPYRGPDTTSTPMPNSTARAT